MKKQRTIVVLGGAQSGPTAAARARETDESARIVLIERAQEVSYAAAGLAYHLSGEVRSLADLNRETASLFRDVYGIEVRIGVEVLRIDPAKRVVELAGESLAYDSLIYALGAESPVPEPLSGATNVFRFRTLPDLAAILERLGASRNRVAVVGGGFFGVEAADGLLRHHAEVTLIERGPRILSSFSPSVSVMATESLAGMGARVVTSRGVLQAQRSGDEITALVLDSGERIAVDFVVVAAGVAPRTELLARAGAKLTADGCVDVDERMRTNLPGVYACGVCAGVENAVTGKRGLLPQASIADKTAQVAGANAAGEKLQMPPVYATSIVRAGEVTCARTGLGHAEAKKGVTTTRVHAMSHDAWFPGASPISIELRHHRKTGRLLGADLCGKHGVDKRVDVLATALAGRLTVRELAELDLAYAPPFSAARDPVNVAATVALATQAEPSRAVEPKELAHLGEVLLVDVRARKDPLPGAIHMPLEQLRERFAELPATGRLVFVDDRGRAGYLAARIAEQRGRRDAGYLSGGLRSLELEAELVVTFAETAPADAVRLEPGRVFEAGLANHHVSNTAYPIAHERTLAPYRVREAAQRETVTAAFEGIDDLCMYVHVPFCETRCAFCEYTVVKREEAVQHRAYVDAAIEELALWDQALGLGKRRFHGLDFGGGTPTFLPAEELARLLGAVQRHARLEPNARISIETTPRIAAREPARIAAIAGLGIERISMGVQVTEARLLRELGRGDNGVDEQRRAAEHIHRAGFSRFNVDLMYGFAGQTLEGWRATLKHAISLGPDAITLYRMRYKLTRVSHQAAQVTLEHVRPMAELAKKVLGDAGFRANPGKTTLSRLDGEIGTSSYLTRRVRDGMPYLGVGLGAQSFSHTTLSYNDGAAGKNLAPYLRSVARGRLPLQDLYLLSREHAMAKMCAVSFYFGEIDRAQFASKFGLALEAAFPAEIDFLLGRGLMEWTDRSLRLTAAGTGQVNGVIALFFAPSVQSYLVLRDPARAEDFVRQRRVALRVAGEEAAGV